MTAADPVASRLLDRTGVCGARRGRLSQREKVTGRAFDRQIGSTKRGDHYADCRIRTESPSTAIFATLPVTASGHPGNLGPDGGSRRASRSVPKYPPPHRWAAAGPFPAMTAAHPVASRSPNRTGVCGARRGRLSQREKVTGRAFDRHFTRFFRSVINDQCSTSSGKANGCFGSTIEIRMENAVVVARCICATTRGSELSTYPRRWR